MAQTRDPYQVLGVSRSASPEDIKSAYRRLAKQYHPDLNPGRSDIEQRFKEVSAAYTLLSDAGKRRRFDQGEIDASGAERPDFAFNRAHSARGGGRGRPGADPFAGLNTDDIFAEFFGGAGGGRRETKARGSDIEYSVTVSFIEAAIGAKRRISLSNGKSIDLTVPPGSENEQKLRLKGQGMPGTGGGPAGDAIVELLVDPHPFFSRKGHDVHVEVPVTLPEALLGATIKVPTLDGTVALKVPKGSNSGTVLRLKNKGIPEAKHHTAGYLYVTLKVMLPDPPDPELSQFIEKWGASRTYDVRKKAGLE
ncbi:MAG: J domain-containing protein [Rhodospirillaceae bacterium]